MGIFPSKRRSIGLLSAFLAHGQADRVDSVWVVASLPAAAATLLLLAIARLRHSPPRRRRFAAEAPCWSACRPIDACDASPIMAKQHQPRRRSVCLAFPGLSYTTTILSPLLYPLHHDISSSLPKDLASNTPQLLTTLTFNPGSSLPFSLPLVFLFLSHFTYLPGSSLSGQTKPSRPSQPSPSQSQPPSSSLQRASLPLPTSCSHLTWRLSPHPTTCWSRPPPFFSHPKDLVISRYFRSARCRYACLAFGPHGLAYPIGYFVLPCCVAAAWIPVYWTSGRFHRAGYRFGGFLPDAVADWVSA